ncbi:MAG: hypothetical protein ACRENG_08560 [bacterium]
MPLLPSNLTIRNNKVYVSNFLGDNSTREKLINFAASSLQSVFLKKISNAQLKKSSAYCNYIALSIQERVFGKKFQL